MAAPGDQLDLALAFAPVAAPTMEPSDLRPHSARAGPQEAAAAPSRPAPAPRDPRALFRHPQFNREIHLGGQLVAYELRRARRRTIGFVVGEEGLRVSAPRWVAQGDIDRALTGKSAWILRKLLDQGERLQRLEAARIEWRDGVSLPYLGEPLRIVLDARVAGWRLDETPPPARCLRLGLPPEATAGQIREAVQSWLQRQALALFEQRCQDYAGRLRVHVRRLRLSSARTRWGSASADGTVRLNWRLIHFPLPTIDYVVAHELAHLHEMNHSPAFWAVVHAVMPDYEQRRGTLKDGAVPVYD